MVSLIICLNLKLMQYENYTHFPVGAVISLFVRAEDKIDKR